jgi:hypothetical protein
MSDYLGQVLEFAWAVINNWAGYATGGLIVALIWLWTSVRGAQVSKKFAVVLALIFLFLAFFNAWREQYLKTHPGVLLTIDELGVGSDVTNSFAKVFITADVANRSQPTTLDEWKLEIKLPGSASPIFATPIYINPEEPLTFTGTHPPNKDFKLDSADALYNKTKPTPVATGAKIPGVLAFDVQDKTADHVRVKGTVFTLSCKTIFGDLVKGSYTWTGINTPHQYIPGLKPPPK